MIGLRQSHLAPLVLLAALAGCSKSSADPAVTHAGSKPKLEFPVEVAPVDLREVAYLVGGPGTIEAFEQVQITARVGGAVDKVAFKEGQTVKAGDVLVVIERDRYQVAVDQAQAMVDKAAAAEQQAEAELQRRQGATAAHPGLIPGEEIATYSTTVATSKSDVAAAREALKVAQLNLRDAYVRAPIAGVIQTRTVETGQYLTPGTVLGTLVQRDPLLLKFQVSEQDAPRIKPGMIAHLTLRESQRTYDAKITLTAAAADPATRLVPVTGEVDDTAHQYWLRPGAFCDVTVPVGAPRQAAVVPEISIRPSERGFLAYVVQGTTAKEHVVQLGMHTGTGYVEVTQGIAPGDLLVVRGAEPLSDGAPVKIVDRTTLEAFDAGADAAPPPATIGSGTPGTTTVTSGSASAPPVDPSAAPGPRHGRDAGATP